jgi:hypothetical protein
MIKQLREFADVSKELTASIFGDDKFGLLFGIEHGGSTFPRNDDKILHATGHYVPYDSILQYEN